MFHGFFSKKRSTNNHGNLDGFLQFFRLQDKLTYSGDLYQDFITQLGGRQFGGGLFSSFSVNNAEQWRQLVFEAFPETKGSFKLFGYDWMGNCFGIDTRPGKNEQILLFEIGTGDLLVLSPSLAHFLNEEIPQRHIAALASEYFKEWVEHAKSAPAYGNCVGYIVPPFLNGDDELANMEMSDMEVYWSIMGQIKTQI